MSRSLLVLGWHSIDPTPAFPAPPEAGVSGRQGFMRQLAALRRCANVLPLTVAMERIKSGHSLPPRSVALTFDDGYRDSLSVVAPCLNSFGYTGTFFLVPEFLSRSTGAWWEDLASAFNSAAATKLEWCGSSYDLRDARSRRASYDHVTMSLKQLDHEARIGAVEVIARKLGVPSHPSTYDLFLDWQEAKALAAAGHEIGAHSMTHPIMARERIDRQEHEILESRKQLQARLGLPVETFAYPNGYLGDYGAECMRLIEDAGYSCAVSTRPDYFHVTQSRYEVGRLVIDPYTNIISLLRRAWQMYWRPVARVNQAS